MYWFFSSKVPGRKKWNLIEGAMSRKQPKSKISKMTLPQKLNIELPHDPAMPPKNWEQEFEFITVLFIMTERWKQCRRPTDEWINQMWCGHTIEYFSALKGMKFWWYGWTLKHPNRKKPGTNGQILCDCTLWGIYTSRGMELMDRGRIVAARGWGESGMAV